MLLVVVTGVPGSGKSTLGTPLAAALGVPLFSLDRIKEAVYDAPGRPDMGSFELRLIAESVLGALLRSTPGAVVDIWLDPSRNDRDRLRASLPGAASRCEVRCEVTADLAVERYRGRVRHRLHTRADTDVVERISRSVDLLPSQSSGLGPLIRVDTTAAVNLPALVSRIRDSAASRSAHRSRTDG